METILFFIVLNMSDFIAKKVYLCGILWYYFIQKKSASGAFGTLVVIYGDQAMSETLCRNWFRRFQNNDFAVRNK